MVKYGRWEYPADVPIRISEIAGHFDKSNIYPKQAYSLHTEYSFGSREFNSRCLNGLDVIRNSNLTSVRAALNGYQKGKCFYCFDDINVTNDSTNSCDVDHFIPHTLQQYTNANLDGVWNLVLSCEKCNRGDDGKFAKVPALKYLERLSKRNDFLISSHHPLRETLMNQTGRTEGERHLFLQSMYNMAKNYLIHTWETTEVQQAIF